MALFYETIVQGLKHRVSLTPDGIALSEAGKSYSWNELDCISDKIAQQLHDMGVGQGCNAGIWGINSPYWVFVFFGLCKAGAVPVLINICFQETELTAVLKNTNIGILLYGKAAKGTSYKTIIDRLDFSLFPELKTVIPFEPDSDENGEPCPLDYFGTDIKPDKALIAELSNAVKPEDCAAILYTSGTTAIPKGVMLSHISLTNNAHAHVQIMHWNSSDKICLCVPLMHCFGITTCLLAAVYSGASLEIISYYKSEKVLTAIQEKSCTVLNGVPSMFLALIHNENFKNYRITGLKSGIIAGSHIGKKEYMQIRRELNIDKLQIAYGQTETSPCVTVMPYDETEKKADSCGKPIENVQVKILHSDLNTERNPCTKMRHGEVLVKGYNVMMGYYNMPELTKKTFTDDGWLKTGDIGYMDGDGYLHITGRIKDIIIRGGENISPQEIENCISELDGIKNVKVIGLPEKVIQEKIVACICSNNTDINEAAVKNHVAARLAKYKVPERVLFFTSLPFTANGKVNKKKLKEEAAALLKKQKEKNGA